MNDFEEARPRSSRNNINAVLDPAVSAAIQSAISELMGSLTNNLIKVIESQLSNFAKGFLEEDSSSVDQAVKGTWREQYTCKTKGNQQQLDQSPQVLGKLDKASDTLYEKVKVALESATE